MARRWHQWHGNTMSLHCFFKPESSFKILCPSDRAADVRIFVPSLWPDSVQGCSTGSQDKVRARKSEGPILLLLQSKLLYMEAIEDARSIPCPNP